MSNERIDLTQFEGITKGPWISPVLSGGMIITEYPHPIIVKQENGEGDCRLQLGKMNSIADRKAVAKLPDLIDELKRSYEEIDALQGKIDDAHEVMEKYSNEEIDNVCDAYEEVCMALG